MDNENMKVIEENKTMCFSCLDIHKVKKVEIKETLFYKDTIVVVGMIYNYCDEANELIETEEQIKQNSDSIIKRYEEIQEMNKKLFLH